MESWLNRFFYFLILVLAGFPMRSQAQSDLPKVVSRQYVLSVYFEAGIDYFISVTLDSIKSQDSTRYYTAYFSETGDSNWLISNEFYRTGEFRIDKRGNYAVRYANSDIAFWRDTFYPLVNLFSMPDSVKVPSIMMEFKYENNKISYHQELYSGYLHKIELRNRKYYYFREFYISNFSHALNYINDTGIIGTSILLNIGFSCDRCAYLETSSGCVQLININDTIAYDFQFDFQNNAERFYIIEEISKKPKSNCIFYRYISTSDPSLKDRIKLNANLELLSEIPIHQINIYELTGKCIRRLENNCETGTIPLKEYLIHSGIYLIEIHSTQGRILLKTWVE